MSCFLSRKHRRAHVIDFVAKNTHLCMVMGLKVCGNWVQAIPVVAHRATFFPASFNTLKMVFMATDLPVPACPQRTTLWPPTANSSALFCSVFKEYILPNIYKYTHECMASDVTCKGKVMSHKVRLIQKLTLAYGWPQSLPVDKTGTKECKWPMRRNCHCHCLPDQHGGRSTANTL